MELLAGTRSARLANLPHPVHGAQAMISPGDSPQVKVAKGAAIIFAGLVFARVVNYAYQILITRFAGADEYGLFFQGVTTLAVAAGMAVLGYDLGVARFAPFYMGSRDENRLHGFIRGAFLLSLANGVAAGIILWLLAGWLSGLYFGGEALRGQTIIRICAAVMPFAVSRMVLIKAIVAFQKIGYRVAVNQFASPVVRLALTALLLAAGMAAEGAMLAYAASELVSWAALLWILQKRVHPIFGASGGAFTLKPFISYCLPLLFSAIVLQVMNSIDTLMTGYFLDIGQVGVFGAATLLASLVSISIEVLNPLFLSITTSAFAEDRHHVVTGHVQQQQPLVPLPLPARGKPAGSSGPAGHDTGLGSGIRRWGQGPAAAGDRPGDILFVGHKFAPSGGVCTHKTDIGVECFSCCG